MEMLIAPQETAPLFLKQTQLVLGFRTEEIVKLLLSVPLIVLHVFMENVAPLYKMGALANRQHSVLVE